jgi:hypothetical protein
MTEPSVLRVVSFDLADRPSMAVLATMVRARSPDVVILQHGPRRLRWRTRGATLASEFGLVVGGGGEPALGNLVLVNLRVAVHETWSVQFPLRPGRQMRGAALVRGSVRGRGFVVAGTALSPTLPETRTHAAIVHRVLSEVDQPVVLAAQVGTDHTGWRTLAQGRCDAGAGRRTGESTAAIFVSPELTIRDYHEVAVTGSRHPLIMAELTLDSSDDHGQMVSGPRSH